MTAIKVIGYDQYGVPRVCGYGASEDEATKQAERAAAEYASRPRPRHDVKINTFVVDPSGR